MASSNRHWPSLFKSKPHSHHHQWQHDMMISPNPLLPNGCHRAAPFSPSRPHHLMGQVGGGGEERSPEPKPRWNPKPEQIRILEAIFNSGMVNPPREEIRKIRAQLQEYGQVGDANVFYWFQNRKSRSKNKQRHLHNASPCLPPSPTSSYSSEKSSSTMSCLNSIINSTTTTAYSTGNNVGGLAYNNYNFATNGEFFSPDPTFLFPEGEAPQYTQGFCFSELSNVVSAPAVSGPSTNLLLSELMSHGYNEGGSKKDDDMIDEAAKMKMETQLMMSTVSSAAAYDIAPPPSTTLPLSSTINLVQGVGMADAMEARSTMIVFVNDVAFEVSTGPIHVRDTFGGDVALLNSNGQRVLTSEWGVTLEPLEAGSFYYVL